MMAKRKKEKTKPQRGRREKNAKLYLFLKMSE
jgi:hypothetical protein